MPCRHTYRNALGTLKVPEGSSAYVPPTPKDWRGILKVARLVARTHGLRVPVRITVTATPPEDAQAATYTRCDDTGCCCGARIYVSSELARAPAIDTLLHELAHVMYEERLGTHAILYDPKNDAEAHPHGFWTIYGDLYNEWMRLYGN